MEEDCCFTKERLEDENKKLRIKVDCLEGKIEDIEYKAGLYDDLESDYSNLEWELDELKEKIKKLDRIIKPLVECIERGCTIDEEIRHILYNYYKV
jgi:predicted  nucleic acid-binding Zn-ribbon protein